MEHGRRKEPSVSGESTVRDSGGLLRETFRGPCRDRHTYHAGLPRSSGCGHHMPGLFREYDGLSTGKSEKRSKTLSFCKEILYNNGVGL